MLLLILALLVILALFGAGFALHLLWWVAIVALLVFVVHAVVNQTHLALTPYLSGRTTARQQRTVCDELVVQSPSFTHDPGPRVDDG